MEARRGFEPLDKGFADLSLSHLGTSPLKVSSRRADYQTAPEFIHSTFPISQERVSTLVLLGGDKVHSSVKFVSRRGCPSPPALSRGVRVAGGRVRGQLPTEPHFLAVRA